MKRLSAFSMAIFICSAMPYLALPANDFGFKAPLKGWMVPPLSPSRVLPMLPAPDDIIEKTPGIDIIAAIGEYEPASFVLQSAVTVEKLVVASTGLSSKKGEKLPASILDLYVVGVWRQGGNAWFLGDREPGPAVLVPELLLHDPSLVTTTSTKKNRVRTPSGIVEIDENVPSDGKELVAAPDAKALLPVPLEAKRLKQFYLIAKIPDDAKPGVYSGFLKLTADGKDAGSIPIALRVLPFRLPAPATRDDHNRPYDVLLSSPPKGFTPVLRDDIENHGVSRPVLQAEALSSETAKIGTAKDSPVWVTITPDGKLPDLSSTGISPKSVFLVRNPADHATINGKDLEKKILAGYKTAIAADPDEIYAELSPVVSACFCDSLPRPHLVMRWHAIGNRLISSAPLALAGVENPEVWRRRIGFLPYQQGADGVLLPPPFDLTSWHDSDQKRANGKRAPALVYPTTSSPIPTLAWEGVREGVDDVRYLTLLSKLADACLASPNAKVRTEGRLAGVWMNEMRADKGNLDGLRLEAIAWILRLQQVHATASKEGARHE